MTFNIANISLPSPYCMSMCIDGPVYNLLTLTFDLIFDPDQHHSTLIYCMYQCVLMGYIFDLVLTLTFAL